MIAMMDNRTLQLIKDKNVIANLIRVSGFYKNSFVERRSGADQRMQERARFALRFILDNR